MRNLELLMVFLFIAYLIYRAILQISFFKTLKKEDAEKYKEYSKYGIGYTMGFSGFDYVLTKQFQNSPSEKVQKLGSKLLKTYEMEQLMIGMSFWLIPIALLSLVFKFWIFR